MAFDSALYPLPGFAFRVNLTSDANEAAYFKSVSGLKYETETVPVVAGGSNNTTFNLVGATKWANLVFKRGYARGSSLLLMRQQWLQGASKARIAQGSIVQLDSQLNAIGSWTFTRGWPVKWEVTDFDASKSEISIETLEIAHDGLTWG